MAHHGFASTCLAAASVFASCAQAADGSVPFPTEPGETAQHCLTVSGAARAVGTHFTANPKAVPLAEPGAQLAEETLLSGAVPKDYLKSLEADRDKLQNEAMAFLVQVGIPSQTRNPTNEALAEIASHLAQCKAWLIGRPPELAPVPKEGDAMVDHCVVVAMSAQSLSASGSGAQATRTARNGRDMLAEMQRTGIVKAQALRTRLQGPEGDLYLQGMDMAMKLKIARPGPKGLDARSLRLLDERIGKCHKALGLQMPLE